MTGPDPTPELSSSADDVSRETVPAEVAVGQMPPPMPPQVAERYPAAAVGLAAYADLLATDGVVRGLIGPREVPRLWDRHLLNCVVIEELIPSDLTVADVGAGAGLPGIPLALVRPDLKVNLIESMLRRTTFLEEVVASLGLTNVTVLRARVEELPKTTRFDVVTSRAVAPLPKLAAWCAPILASQGRILALKGDQADVELAEAQGALKRLKLGAGRIVRVGEDVVSPQTTVVELTGPQRALASARSRARAAKPTRPDKQRRAGEGRTERRSQGGSTR